MLLTSECLPDPPFPHFPTVPSPNQPDPPAVAPQPQPLYAAQGYPGSYPLAPPPGDVELAPEPAAAPEPPLHAPFLPLHYDALYVSSAPPPHFAQPGEMWAKPPQPRRPLHLVQVPRPYYKLERQLPQQEEPAHALPPRKDAGDEYESLAPYAQPQPELQLHYLGNFSPYYLAPPGGAGPGNPLHAPYASSAPVPSPLVPMLLPLAAYAGMAPPAQLQYGQQLAVQNGRGAYSEPYGLFAPGVPLAPGMQNSSSTPLQFPVAGYMGRGGVLSAPQPSAYEPLAQGQRSARINSTPALAAPEPRAYNGTALYDDVPLAPTQGLKRNQCPVCHKVFKRPLSFQIHFSIHTGVKLFKCEWEGCGRLFNVKSNMTRHYKLHLKHDS